MSEAFDERDRKMLRDCIEYGKDPYGAPNHLLMVLVSKLYNLLRESEQRQINNTSSWVSCPLCNTFYMRGKSHVCGVGGL
jgi:hypothetical protein